MLTVEVTKTYTTTENYSATH